MTNTRDEDEEVSRLRRVIIGLKQDNAMLRCMLADAITIADLATTPDIGRGDTRSDNDNDFGRKVVRLRRH
jgi:hypothetical protein